MVNPVNTVTRIKPRRPVRIAPRRKKSTSDRIDHVGPHIEAQGPSLVAIVKASEHLIRTIEAPERGREKHQPKDLLRMVAKFLLESGKGYQRAEVLEVLQCFTGCGTGAAGEALQVMLMHGIVTTVNEVITVTW